LSGLGWCAEHYERARYNNGDPLAAASERTPPGTALAYFHANLYTPTPPGQCRLWPFPLDSGGYGQIRIDGRHVRVHVLTCTAHHGPRPPGLQAAHECGNPTCWAYEHLSWKTPPANADDKRRHGTHLFGDRHPSSLLTEIQVREILEAYAATDQALTTRALAKRYGIADTTLWHILTGRTWKHVPRPEGFNGPRPILRGEQSKTARLTEAQVLEIIALTAVPGVNLSALARWYGVGHTTIQRIAENRAWRHLPRPTKEQAA
jgi:transposase-like protein